MSDPSPEKLPELQDALLGDDELSALFRDYRSCAAMDEILIKTGPRQVQPALKNPTLDEAEQQVRCAPVRGVQIRYQFQGEHWCDTLIPGAQGVRLVRIRQTP